MKKTKDVIEVLHEKDLEQFLIEYDLFEDFQKKSLTCKICENPITSNNICALKLTGEKLEFICNNKSCYESFLHFQEGE